LSSIYTDDKSGIAVFEPVGDDKYKLVSREWRNDDDIVISGFIANDKWYDIIGIMVQKQVMLRLPIPLMEQKTNRLFSIQVI